MHVRASGLVRSLSFKLSIPSVWLGEPREAVGDRNPSIALRRKRTPASHLIPHNRLKTDPCAGTMGENLAGVRPPPHDSAVQIVASEDAPQQVFSTSISNSHAVVKICQ